MKYIFAYLVLLTIVTSSKQESYVLTNENIVMKSSDLIDLQNQRLYYTAGHHGKQLVYQINTRDDVSFKNGLDAISRVYYNEKTKQITDSFNVRRTNSKIFKIKQVNEIVLFHGYLHLPKTLVNKSMRELSIEPLSDYQDFWIGDTAMTPLKSYKYNFYDRDIDYFVEPLGRYITMTPFVPEYLRSTEADSIISIWDVSDRSAQPKEIQLSCIECIQPQIVGDYIYYSKKFFPLYGADAYDWKLFRAPLFDLSKSEMIGDYFELLLISPDGKYALGKKTLMREVTLAIMEISTKKIQYLLGRDYKHLKFFYSPGFQKFAFDSKNHIVYIDYPKEFPFKAIGPEAKPIHVSKEESVKFWSKFKHAPLK